MDATTYPTVKIGDQVFEVKFRNYDLIKLKREHGIDLLGGLKEMRGADALEQTGKMLAAGIAHQQAMSVEDVVNGMDFSQLAGYANAVNQALLKVLAQLAPVTQKPADPGTTLQ